MKAKTDEQLIQQLRKGNIPAVDELYRRYARSLYVFFKTMMGAQNPEDLVHDIFLRVVERTHQFNPKKASFKTWIFRIARNRAIDLLRREKKLSFLSLEQKKIPSADDQKFTLEDTLADDEPPPEEKLLEATVIQTVRDCIGELQKEEEKQAVVLYYLFDKVYREIGDIFGKSTSRAKELVASAKEKIKRCLEKKGVDTFPDKKHKMA